MDELKLEYLDLQIKLSKLETLDFYGCQVDFNEWVITEDRMRELEKLLNLPPYKGKQFYLD
jgi:hypothetical protein